MKRRDFAIVWVPEPRLMCALLELNDRQVQLGQSVAVWLEGSRVAWLAWTGFARSESIARWLAMGAQLVDVPARRFAQRSNRTRRLQWEDIPLGLVMRGLIDSNNGKPLLKIVTRAANARECAHFEHPRIPLVEVPRVSAERILPPAPVLEQSLIVQPELFARRP